MIGFKRLSSILVLLILTLTLVKLVVAFQYEESDDGGVDPDDKAEAMNRIIECQDPKNWTCLEYRFVISKHGNGIANTLNCIGYNKYEPPWEKTVDTVNLTVKGSLKKITNLDTDNQAMSVILSLQAFWNDPRLAFPKDCYDEDNIRKFPLDSEVWSEFFIPDLTIDGLLKLQEVDALKVGSTVALYQNGVLALSGKYDISVGCKMDFTKFPFDDQQCYFDLYVEDGSSDEVSLEWFKPVEEATNLSRIYVPDWETQIVTLPKTYLASVEKGYERDSLRFSISFNRIYTNHILHTYIPSVMLCLGSCLSVFVPSDLVPGRMGLCVTTFLSIISLFNGARSGWPRTSYMKAIDTWTVGCYVTVFYALAEYCIVLYLTKYSEWERRVQKHKKQQKRDRIGSKVNPQVVLPQPKKKEKIFDAQGNKIRRKEMTATTIEYVSRFILPLFFILFNLIYWAVSLT